MLQHADVEREVGLEIGPLDKPPVRRTPGRRIYYCDYAPQETLRTNSSADPNVRIDEIPEIDFVTTQIRTEDFGGTTFDYVVASHVVEHVPDMLGWLAQLRKALNPGGRIILAVPDRRYTFDFPRPLSTFGQLMEARHEQRSRPTFSQVYDAFSMAAKVDTALCWSQPGYPGTPLEFYYSRELALRLAEDARDRGGYHDCHCWVFTYESFLELVAQANEMGILDVRITASAAPVWGANEFHVVLSGA